MTHSFTPAVLKRFREGQTRVSYSTGALFNHFSYSADAKVALCDKTVASTTDRPEKKLDCPSCVKSYSKAVDGWLNTEMLLQHADEMGDPDFILAEIWANRQRSLAWLINLRSLLGRNFYRSLTRGAVTFQVPPS